MPKMQLGTQHTGDTTDSALGLPDTRLPFQDHSGSRPQHPSATTSALHVRRLPEDRMGRERDAVTAVANHDAFRFFDLPPEMRNMVYRELLIFARKPTDSVPVREEATCDLAILRTCRQAYDEAKDILYEENSFDVDLGTVVAYWDANGGGPSYSAVIAVNGREVQELQFDDSDYWFDWPGILLKRSRVNLRITKMDLGSELSTAWWIVTNLNHALCDLVQFLRASDRLRTVHVSFITQAPVQPNTVDKLIAPLRLLRAEKVIACSGGLGSSTQEIQRLLNA